MLSNNQISPNPIRTYSTLWISLSAFLILVSVGWIGEAIKWQTINFQDRTGIHCELKSNPKKITLDPKLSTMIFRIYQEVLTNIARHAEADRVFTQFEIENNSLLLNVQDNGKGIDIN